MDIRVGDESTRKLLHRGPDHLGKLVDRTAGLYLGHTRLSIIDVSKESHQPMSREDAVLAYNGEIYNYKELARELRARKISLTTTGDTEVLLQSWLTWGSGCLGRLDGMFAFALHQRDQINLATDHFGEKPLYWAQTREGLYFSSEPWPLRDALKLRPSLNRHEMGAFLSMGFLPPPSTGIPGLNRMPPGSLLQYSRGGTPRIIQHWSPPRPERRTGRVQPLTETELDSITEALSDSLRVRYRADVPIVLFLSSGIDSSLIAALTAKVLRKDVKALTVAFPEASVADEAMKAAEIAQYLGIEHQVIDSPTGSNTTTAASVVGLYGEATSNLTIIPALQMAQVAAQEAKVALSGIGGDEVFFGYKKYLEFYRMRRWLGMPRLGRQIASALMYLGARKKTTQLRQLMTATDDSAFLAIKNLNAIGWLRNIEGYKEWARTFIRDWDLPIEIWSRQVDLLYTMPGSYIPAIERASMRASLEVRTPFLNRRLLHVVDSMDPRAFMAFGQKSVLRRILARHVPVELVEQDKYGFFFPNERLLSASQRPSHIPGLSRPAIEELWSRKDEARWSDLAARIVVLDQLLRSTAADEIATV